MSISKRSANNNIQRAGLAAGLEFIARPARNRC
jgi:hypothetical protein